jgi:uncharacterized protein (DUF2249 family)
MQELDVRTLASRNKHPKIPELLRNLADGETLHLIDDHDARPLRFQIEADYPAAFQWEYLERGPDVWRVMERKGFATQSCTRVAPDEVRVVFARRSS